VRNLAAPRSLHRVYVNFPDPWPKQRHRARRLLQAPFFRLLSTRLEDGGELLLTTDHRAYLQEALAAARSTGLFEAGVLPPPQATLGTKYARKWRGQERDIHHAVFRKRAEAAEPFPPTVEIHPAMHHVHLAGDLPDLASFEKQVHAFHGGHVILLEAYRSVAGEGLLFVARIEEEDLTQEVLVEARPSGKEPGGLLVGVKLFNQPLATRGTREAVLRVAAWLKDRMR
jgi:tRNA (guanine-N7-)-methyltransferase